MQFREAGLKGAYIIEMAPIEDERGFFARSFCRKEFRRMGLTSCIAQCNISFNRKKGTLRGLHYQEAPKEEAKLVSCLNGAIYDVIVDLRPDSSTFRHWTAVKLSVGNKKMIYVPEGFAHGFQALEDNTLVLYKMSEFYAPDLSRGYRWDDPAFGIRWPLENKIISPKDRRLPYFAS